MKSKLAIRIWRDTGDVFRSKLDKKDTISLPIFPEAPVEGSNIDTGTALFIFIGVGISNRIRFSYPKNNAAIIRSLTVGFGEFVSGYVPRLV